MACCTPDAPCRACRYEQEVVRRADEELLRERATEHYELERWQDAMAQEGFL